MAGFAVRRVGGGGVGGRVGRQGGVCEGGEDGVCARS